MTKPSLAALGEYLREQRELAHLSLREMSRLARVSNAYLSQIERGLHEPSLRVLQQVAAVLEVPVEDLVAHHTPPALVRDVPDVELAIRQETRLSKIEKEALISVFRSYVDPGQPEEQP